MKNPRWLKDEIILVMDFYMDNFNNIPRTASNEIAELSSLLNKYNNKKGLHGDTKFRNPNSVHIKLMNFLSLDERYEGKGLQSASKNDKEAWEDFKDNREQLKHAANKIRDYITSSKERSFDIDFDVDDEIEEEAKEGRVITRIHQAYERDSKLVRKKKEKVLREKRTLDCEVCGFNFTKSYGERGKDFIECHHNKPISEIGDKGKTKLEDLTLLCSNCHRMIHRKRPWLTIHELEVLDKR